MTERSDIGGRTRGRQPAEGVRIIPAEEAQAAIDKGEAAGRRPDDELRYGDVPPAPQGPRPAHRFPLPDSIDPAEAVPLPPLAPPRSGSGREQRDQTEWDFGDRTAEMDPSAASAPPALSAAEEQAGVPATPAPASPDEGITVTGGHAELPHWTDPPTGEVPRLLPEDEFAEESGEDDLDAWRALGSRGIRWRDAEDDWGDSDDIEELGGEDSRVGALDQTRSEQSDLYSFDEDFERLASRTAVPTAFNDFEDEPALEPPREAAPRARHARSGTRGADTRSGGRRPVDAPPARRGAARFDTADDMGSRVAVGVGLILLLIIAYAIGPKALVALVALVVVAALAETFGMLQRSGFRPATLLGLVAAVGLVLGAYWKGLEAVPLAIVLVFAGSMMWYILRIVQARPLANVAVTNMAFVWVAVLGTYASLMLRQPHGKGLFLGVVLVAVAADIVAFVVGRWIGSRPMAPSISPNKTIEGFIGGLLGAIVVGALVGKFLTPWGGMRHGLVLGIVVGLIAPMGDLFESMVKRDLGIKDTGSVLPGHGGLMDRFDSLLLALPAAYYVGSLFNLIPHP
jgi:phosphatidate cytidylyltransferase